jgi:hypothetical protein
MRRSLSLPRFAALELLAWASVYPAYLAIRGSSIDSHKEAVAHAAKLVAAFAAILLLSGVNRLARTARQQRAGDRVPAATGDRRCRTGEAADSSPPAPS